MRTPSLFVLIPSLAVPALLNAQDLSKLPDWAQAAAHAAMSDQAPATADAWVLLQRTEVAYTGGGELRIRKLRLVKVLGERGISEGTFALYGLGGKASKVKKLKGWNLRPDGELVKLDSDAVVTISDAGDEDFATTTLTGARLDRVAKGSLVAFESDEVMKHPLGPVAGMMPLEHHPVRLFEFEVAERGWWLFAGGLVQVPTALDVSHFRPWLPDPEVVTARKVVARNLPALPKEEGAGPHPFDFLPRVTVRFFDPANGATPDWRSWNGQATWLEDQYRSRLKDVAPMELQQGLPGLRQLWSWMGKELTYRQVYLTPERGWVPEAPRETARRRFGDCKDLSCFFMAHAQGLGFETYPVLARIGEGRVDSQSTPMPSFNHVISALKLPQSLGLPAEIETPQGRFLLADPTHASVPLGYLGDEHRGRSVLICMPKGGLWAEVPASALLEPSIKVDLQGECDAAGKVSAKVTLHESGDAWGLRQAVLSRGPAKLREFILDRLISLSPTASLSVEAQGDALDAGKPFTVTLAMTQPNGLRIGGGEAVLEDWWMRIVPDAIQKPGQPRVLPVVKDSAIHLQYTASLKVPMKLAPVLPSQQGETPFRRFSWKAEATAQPGATTIHLSLDHVGKPATFGFDEREKGVQEWKKDRTLVKNLVEDGMAFKVLP